MKKCFSCNRKFPLFFFSKDKMKYQRPHDQGKVKVCRICCYKQWSKDMEAWLYNFEVSKFQKVVFKNKWEIIKKVLNG